MADAKPRTFVKKLADGKELTREVTGASSEVEARYDGFHEKTPSKSTGTSTSTSAKS